MSFWSGPPPNPPNPHETHFLELLREGVGGGIGGGAFKNVEKVTPTFFLVEKHESFGFFRFRVKKMFLGPNSMGFVWGGVGRELLQFQHFSAIFATLAVLTPSVTP